MGTTGLWYTIPLGIATAASILIGQALGAKRPHRTKEITQVVFLMHLAFPIMCGTLLITALRLVWGRMFTNDDDVLSQCASTIPILLPYLVFDHLKCACMAILRGCGRAPATVYGNTLSCLLIGLPLAYILVFNPFQCGLVGLWLAMSAAWAAATLIYCTLITRTDWKNEVEKAQERMKRNAQPGQDKGININMSTGSGTWKKKKLSHPSRESKDMEPISDTSNSSRAEQ